MIKYNLRQSLTEPHWTKCVQALEYQLKGYWMVNWEERITLNSKLCTNRDYKLRKLLWKQVIYYKEWNVKFRINNAEGNIQEIFTHKLCAERYTHVVHDAFTVDVDPCIMRHRSTYSKSYHRGRRKQYQLDTCVHDAIRSWSLYPIILFIFFISYLQKWRFMLIFFLRLIS